MLQLPIMCQGKQLCDSLKTALCKFIYIRVFAPETGLNHYFLYE